MFHSHVLLALRVLPVLLCASPLVADQPAAALAAWLPQDSIVVLEVPEPRAVWDRLFDPRVVQALEARPEYQSVQNQQGFQEAMNLVRHLEEQHGCKAPELLGRLTGGGMALSIGAEKATLLVVEAEDARLLNEVHELFVTIARAEALKDGKPERVASAEYRGVTGWTFARNEAHAINGKRLIVANSSAVLKAAIDRISEADAASLTGEARYQEARQALPADSLMTLFARMDILKQVSKFRDALDQQRNPLITLLLGPLMQSLEQSNWLAVGLKGEGAALSLQIASDGRAAEASSQAGFARPEQPGGGALANLSVPRQLAAVSFYRDLHKFYGAKDELFPERTSGLIFFENMMGIFFTGRDLTEEVLAELTPQVRLVVAQQEYPPEVGTPQMQLPGLAIVFRMRDPQNFSPVAEEAFQKALGLINFTRGQQAEPGLIIDRPIHQDVKYTVSAFAPVPPKDNAPADARFNFQPSLAMPGEYLILSSTDGLARDLIDALKSEAASGPKTLSGQHSLVEIQGPQVASILAANRESMIRQNMVEKGHTREQAEGEIDTLCLIVGAVRKLEIAAGGEGSAQVTVKLELDLQP